MALHDGQQLQQLPDGDVAVISGPDTLTPPDPNWTPPAGDDPLNSDDTSTAPQPISASEPAWFQSALQPTLAQVSDVNVQLQTGDAHASEADDSTSGQALAVFSASPAVDANGRQVPTSLSVQGNQIVTTVSHQGGGFAYPILVDPTATSATATRGNGLSSEQPGTFASLNEAQLLPGNSHLNPRFARIFVPWNYNFSQDGKSPDPNNPIKPDQEVGTWLRTVTHAGLVPIITLTEPDQVNGKFPAAPDLPTYQTAFANWLRFTNAVGVPVPVWGAWNEPDNPSNPLDNLRPDDGAQKAADYWALAERACLHVRLGCHTVLAGEFSGYGYGVKQPSPKNIVHNVYIKAYEDRIAHHVHIPRNPRVWSVHTYTDLINVKDPKTTKTKILPNSSLLLPFAQSLIKPFGRPSVWVTETGVQLRSGGNPTQRLPRNNPLQRAAATDYLHIRDQTRGLPRKIKTALYYTYLADRPGTPFDSGMLNVYPGNGDSDPFCPNPSSRQRPAYGILAGPPPPTPPCSPTSAPQPLVTYRSP